MDLAVVQMHIALTYLLLNDLEESQHWLNEAYAKAVPMARELAEHTGNTKVIKGRGIAQAAAAYATFGASAAYLAVKKVRRTYSNKRAQEGLRGVLPLVRCVVSCSTWPAAAIPANCRPWTWSRSRRTSSNSSKSNSQRPEWSGVSGRALTLTVLRP